MDLENAELQTLLICADNVWENEIKPYASLFCLNGPLTPVAIAGQMLEHECVEGVVSVDLDELINHNHEGLMDIQYKVLVNDGDQILIVVSGIVDSDTLELLGDNDNDDASELPA